MFTFGDPGAPYIARFLPGQRFDLQATIRPDTGFTITNAEFRVDGKLVALPITSTPATVAGLPVNTGVWTSRAFSTLTPGVHALAVTAYQDDGAVVSTNGNFEVVQILQKGRRAKNIIYLIGDGMGIAHRTAARIMAQDAALGKANGPLAMDLMPQTGIVMTHSLNSIVTDLLRPGRIAIQPATKPAMVRKACSRMTPRLLSTTRALNTSANTSTERRAKPSAS